MPKNTLSARERPVVETGDVVVPSRRARGRRSREVILAPRSRRAGRPETARRARRARETPDGERAVGLGRGTDADV